MPITFKIKHTPKLTDESLCKSCKYGQKLRGRTLDEDFNWCTAFEKFIQMHVTECASYHPASERTYHEYKQEAWIKVENEWFSPLEVNGLKMKGKWKAPN